MTPMAMAAWSPDQPSGFTNTRLGCNCPALKTPTATASPSKLAQHSSPYSTSEANTIPGLPLRRRTVPSAVAFTSGRSSRPCSKGRRYLSSSGCFAIPAICSMPTPSAASTAPGPRRRRAAPGRAPGAAGPVVGGGHGRVGGRRPGGGGRARGGRGPGPRRAVGGGPPGRETPWSGCRRTCFGRSTRTCSRKARRLPLAGGSAYLSGGARIGCRRPEGLR